MAEKLLIRFIKNNKVLFFLGVVIVPVIAKIMFIGLVLIYQQITEMSLSSSGNMMLFIYFCMGYIFVLIVFQYLKEKASINFRSRLGESYKEQLGRYLITIKPAEVEKRSLGKLIETFQNVEPLCRLPEVFISILISIIQLLLLSIYVIYEINWKMLLVLIMLVVFSIGISMLSSPLSKKQRNVVMTEEKLINISDHISSGLEVIKSYAKETYFYNAYKNLTRQQSDYEVEVGRNEIALGLANKISTFFILVAAPLIAWYFIQNQSNLEGRIITMTLIYGFLAESFSTLLGNIQAVKKLEVSKELFNEFFAQPDEKQFGMKVYMESTVKNKLQINNIHFNYPNQAKEIIKGISLDIGNAGLYVFVGESGSGKSTLLKIISGLYEETFGFIQNEHQKLSAMERLRLFSYAAQEPWLLPGTVLENIEYAVASNSQSEDNVFLSDIKLDQLQEQFALGNETLIDSEGLNLSGGQKQLVTLLRAFHKKVDVFIFDEPTSSQGANSENLIFEALKKLSRSKVVIVATHRLKIAQEADCIYVIEKGYVAEKGRHMELIKMKGKYYDYFQYEEWQ
ncbi:ATP-binding cassette domain-containing protein [Paenibacillus sp.]|uniref:ATP-binding cassette domain-containing protein n=1 Tax=Paenibacillus sp. TaxID=58172 RepID=UPI0028A84D91|nr:ATP-binding cassette domain-containing protein [Paenibacillus sp.]